MKLYFVSDSKQVLSNTGFIVSSHTSYEAASAKARIGQYIHFVDVQSCVEIINAGKMAVKIDSTNEGSTNSAGS